jgi:hypothetical protein
MEKRDHRTVMLHQENMRKKHAMKKEIIQPKHHSNHPNSRGVRNQEK